MTFNGPFSLANALFSLLLFAALTVAAQSYFRRLAGEIRAPYQIPAESVPVGEALITGDLDGIARALSELRARLDRLETLHERIADRLERLAPGA